MTKAVVKIGGKQFIVAEKETPMVDPSLKELKSSHLTRYC
jgi:hypothetical protein